MKILLLVLGAASFIPIWRAPGYEGGLNVWEYLGIIRQDGYEHIFYETAVERAREAWRLR